LIILNKGNTIALWYAIHIKVTNVHVQIRPNWFVDFWDTFTLGMKDHWQVDEAELSMYHNLEATFTSNGEMASYPNLPLKFCEMEFGWFVTSSFDIASQKRVAGAKEYQFSYTIFTDRGPKKQGSLQLTFQ
jgi:hypothetical protein